MPIQWIGRTSAMCLAALLLFAPSMPKSAVSLFAYDQVRTIKVFSSVTIEPYDPALTLNDLISYRSVNRAAYDIVKDALGPSSRIQVVTADDTAANATINQQDPSLLVLAINVSVRMSADPVTQQSLDSTKNALGIVAISTTTFRTARPFDSEPGLFETRPEAFILAEDPMITRQRLRNALSRQLSPILTALKSRSPQASP
jgi:hypothetical protein